jgi:BRCA1/BRCA2-containing complex subunit 3
MCSQAGKIQVTAFQSQGGQQHNVTPLAIAPPVIDLESSWSSSDNALAIEGIEHDTGDSRFSKSNKV